MIPAPGQARYGNRNAAGSHTPHAELAAESPDWVIRRNWHLTEHGPSLAGLYVAVIEGAAAHRFGVYRLSDPEPRVPISTNATAEHAKRYVDHAHNFGRPPL